MIGFVAAAPVESEAESKPVPQILRSERNQEDNGAWNFLYETDDGSFREEKGVVIDSHNEDEEKKVSITGSYKYIDEEGKEQEVHYTADENGFVPYGSNIPESISNAAKAYHDNPEAHSKH